MDINAFKKFLQSQEDGFLAFLKGCQGSDLDEMRKYLALHSAKMLQDLNTGVPVASSGNNQPFNIDSIFGLPGDVLSQSSPSKSTPNNSTSKSTNAKSSKYKTPSEQTRVASSQRMTLGGVSRLFRPVSSQRPKHAYVESDDSNSSSGSLDALLKKPYKQPSSKKEKGSPLQSKSMQRSAEKINIEQLWKEYENESSTEEEQPPNKKQRTEKRGGGRSAPGQSGLECGF